MKSFYVASSSLACTVAALWSCTSMPHASAFAPRRPPLPVWDRRSVSSASATTLHATSGRQKCRPIGVGSAAPPTVVTNADLERVVETSDEWIQSRTGIASRHVLTGTETMRDLQIQASRNALAMAGVDAADLDLLIVATSSADDLFGDAPSVAAALGCTTQTLAFDLTAACSGFLFATVTAGNFLNRPGAKALVVGADALSRWVDWDDRNTCILFGDAAGAMVLEGTADAVDSGLLGYAGHSNGGGYQDLNLGYTGTERKVSTPGDGTMVSEGQYGKLSMNGREVYKFATREVPKVLTEALEAAEIGVDDVDWILLHQANIRIMETVASRLGVPMEKVITNLSEYGNTSAASIPLALDEAVRKGQVKKGDIIACAGFGAGLSWGAAILKWG
jgi:3-oxoacyl-[acyl-carrier-protein] synthase-3